MNIYDRAARIAIKLNPVGLLIWLLVGLSRDLVFARWLDTQSVAFPGEPERRCDTVAELVSQSGSQTTWACVVEPQGYAEAAFLVRVLSYQLDLHQDLRHGPHGQDRYPVMAAVLNLSDQPLAKRLEWLPPLENGAYAESVRSAVGLKWGIWVGDLQFEDARAVLGRIAVGELDSCLLLWISLMQGGDAPEVIEQWKQLAGQIADHRLRADYAAVALIFAEKTKRAALWKKALEDWNVEESAIGLEWLTKGEARGEARGREQTLRSSLLTVLRARFTQLPARSTLERIENEKNQEALNRWLTVAATVATLEDFQAAVS